MTNALFGLIALAVYGSATILLLHFNWFYGKQRYERKIKIYNNFLDMLEEHSGDIAIIAEIKALKKKLGKAV